jgi:hypothetical protein
MFNRRSLIAVALASSALAGGHSFAQPDQATVGIQTTTRYSLEGRIAAVDTTARMLTITSADGTQRMLNVSPMAANITSTKVGDSVTVCRGNQPGRGRREGLEVDRQLGGREGRPCRQHHHAGQSGWRRSAHLRRDHGRRPSATAAGQAGRQPDRAQQPGGRGLDHTQGVTVAPSSPAWR